MREKVAVIGAGNGGTAIAAHILSMGGNVNFCDLFPEYIEDVKKSGYINLVYHGTVKKVFPTLVTTDISEAIKGTKLIMVVTPAFTHRLIAEACSKFLEDGQIIVLNPGRTAGALEFLNNIRKFGCHKDVIVAETQTLIYSCRKSNGNTVNIYEVKNSVDISCIPNTRINEVIDVLSYYYPQFKPVPNMTWTSFANIGSMFHPTPLLLNIGRIENDKRGFKFYMEGITPSIAELIKVLDKERLSVAKAYGADIEPVEEWLIKCYNTYGNTLYERIVNNKAYEDIFAPTSIKTRYVIEDIPNGLVPISELGKVVNVPTPNIDAIIQIANSIYNTDFREKGRSLINLGIEGMTKEEILHYFETGEKSLTKRGGIK